MKISIVTAGWNRAATLGEAIESVQRQSHADMQTIIQNDGSTDHTLDVIDRLTDDHTHLFSERDGGIYDAINRRIARAMGDVVGLVHSDGGLADDRVIAEIAEVFDTPGIDAVYNDFDSVAGEGTGLMTRHWKPGRSAPTSCGATGWRCTQSFTSAAQF